MRSILFRFLLLSLLVVVICGCSRNPYGGDPVVSVDGAVLFSGEIERRATNISALFLHRVGNPSQCEKVKDTFRSGYLSRWVEDRVLENEAKRLGVDLPEATLEKFRQQAFQNFKAKGDAGYAVLLGLPGMTVELWEDQVRSEARRAAMREHWVNETPTNIPPSYADGVLASIRKWNADMAKTNALQYVKATNVWMKLKQGADFVKTARLNTELTEEIEDDCEWGSLDSQFIEDDPVLARQLKKLKVGEFTPPFDGDGGILIVRLDALEDEGACRVSRIFFRKGNVLQAASRSEIVRAAEEKYAKELFDRRLQALVKAADVRYFKGEKNKTSETKGSGK